MGLGNLKGILKMDKKQQINIFVGDININTCKININNIEENVLVESGYSPLLIESSTKLSCKTQSCLDHIFITIPEQLKTIINKKEKNIKTKEIWSIT